MAEKIEKLEVSDSSPERSIETEATVIKAETPKDINELDKKTILERVYSGDNLSKKEETVEGHESPEDKMVSRFAKEFFVTGTKAVYKALKFFRGKPREIDCLHDKITSRNIEDKNNSR